MDNMQITDDDAIDEEYMHIYRTMHTTFHLALDERETSPYSPEELAIEVV